MPTATSQPNQQDNSLIQAKKLALTLTLFLVLAPLSTSLQYQNPPQLTNDWDFQTSNSTVSDDDIDAILSGLNTSNIPEIVGVVDSNSNYQMIWIDNSTNEIIFAMLDSNGNPLIAPTNLPQSNPQFAGSGQPPMDIVIDIDSEGLLYLFWSDSSIIWGLALNSSEDDQDGDQANVNDIIEIPPTALVTGFVSRYDPDIVIDSFDAIHLVWVDEEDPLGILYNIPQIHYMMIAHSGANPGTFSTIIGSTMVTATHSNSGHPTISMGENDTVVVVWQDTSGSSVEYIGILDTSGSMNTEWADMCVVFYGGNFASGNSFSGIKPLMNASGITVLETLYALSGNWPAASTSGYCANAYQTGGMGVEGPRTTPLGQTPTDDSGGIRYLTDVVFQNASYNLPQDGGYYSEFWGPGTTWACQSWIDSLGRVGANANPPTPLDHRWNNNASKFVIPVSDEGPFGGDPSGETDDYESINEAHDACILAGVIPMPLLASGFSSGADPVGSHMMDLAQCPNGFTNLAQRTCPGTTLRNTDAGGQMYAFPTSSSGSAELQLMVQAILELASSTGTTEIFMTILDPYAFINNPRSTWSQGDSGSITDTVNARYGEYVGPSIDDSGYGNLVIVNDTRITETSGFSKDPDVVVDEEGDIHITWSDYRSGFTTDEYAHSQLNYVRIDPDRAGQNDGNPILMENTAIISPSSIASSNLSWASKPVIGLDSRGVNIAWFETDESITDLRWLVLSDEVENSRETLSQSVYDVYDEISTVNVASGTSSMMGISGSNINGTQPIASFDYPKSSFFWVNENCNGGGGVANQGQLCTRSIIDYNLNLQKIGDTDIISISPDEYVTVFFDLTAIYVPVLQDELSISHTELPTHWVAELGFSENSFLRESISVSTGSVVSIELRILSPILRLANENLTFELDITVSSIDYNSIDETQTLTINFFNLNGFDDDDNDGVLDSEDSCPWGEDNWISDEFSDYDGDGCRDSTEDSDDDNDGVFDDNDNCPMGMIGISPADLDQDGCDDNWEDVDLDEDGVLNPEDDCPQGDMYWDSSLDDYDGDGCADSTEDLNDDNDPHLDEYDDCPTGETDWDEDHYDHDQDGCHDNYEDSDDDNDGVIDSEDDCHIGNLDWTSDLTSDYDGDGCADSVEDMDYDNDGIENSVDLCPFSTPVGLASSAISDWDNDGCLDDYEDWDDDNDGFADEFDSCIRSKNLSDVDLDRDGCMDNTEDNDLDNDGVLSVNDDCEFNPLSTMKSNPETDFDGDGCMDAYEDDDDDGDGVLDFADQCKKSEVDTQTTDTDNDGCLDYSEDQDNDDDGILNEFDNCPSGEIGWISEKSNDKDGDGCLDATEDSHIEYTIFDRILANRYQLTALLVGVMCIFVGRYSAMAGLRKKEELSLFSDFSSDSLNWDEGSEEQPEKKQNFRQELVNKYLQQGYSSEVATILADDELKT